MMKPYRILPNVKMRPIEVYDAKLQKWVPYLPDHEKWYQHFKDMSEGYVQYDPMGQNVVSDGTRYRKLKNTSTTCSEPVAQKLERAKSELEFLRKEETRKDAANGGYSQQVDWNAFRN